MESFYRESQQAVAVCLAELVDDVLELQSRPLQMHGIKLEKQYVSKAVVHGFAVELKQVFLTLLEMRSRRCRPADACECACMIPRRATAGARERVFL